MQRGARAQPFVARRNPDPERLPELPCTSDPEWLAWINVGPRNREQPRRLEMGLRLSAATTGLAGLPLRLGSIVAPLTDLQQVSLTDLAIATLETKACRQLSGIPI